MGDRARADDERRDVCDACGVRHDNARLITLPDGSVIGLQSKEYALYCEAITVLKWPLKKRREHLENVEKKRGMLSRRKLEGELIKQHDSLSRNSGNTKTRIRVDGR